MSVTLQEKLMPMHGGRKLTSPTMSPLQAKKSKASQSEHPTTKKHQTRALLNPGVCRLSAQPDTLIILLIPAPSKQTPSIELGGINTLTHPPLILKNNLSSLLPYSAALHPAGSWHPQSSVLNFAILQFSSFPPPFHSFEGISLTCCKNGRRNRKLSNRTPKSLYTEG